MNWLDLILVLLVLFGILAGIGRGFLRTGLDLAVLVVSAFGGMLLYARFADLFSRVIEAERATLNVLGLAASSLITFSVLSALVMTLATPTIDAVRRIPRVRLVDTVFGAVPGLVYGLMFGLMLSLMFSFFSFGSGVDRALAESGVANRLRGSAQQITGNLATRTGADLADFSYIVAPDGGTSYRLPPVGDTGIDASLEDEERIFRLVNDARNEHGLPPLQLDESLREVARQHSEEMLRLGYFAHESPNTGTLGDRLRANDIPYRHAGENLAYAPSADVAHRGLMQSPGHRANILEAGYSRLGVGVLRSPDGTIMVTQVFSN
jgi:uncharacterized protein YkwD/uncharacterized membrane protein required for colicin V production